MDEVSQENTQQSVQQNAEDMRNHILSSDSDREENEENKDKNNNQKSKKKKFMYPENPKYDDLRELNRIMNLYKEWHFQFMPKYDFNYFLNRLQAFGLRKGTADQKGMQKIIMDKLRQVHKGNMTWEDFNPIPEELVPQQNLDPMADQPDAQNFNNNQNTYNLQSEDFRNLNISDSAPQQQNGERQGGQIINNQTDKQSKKDDKLVFIEDDVSQREPSIQHMEEEVPISNDVNDYNAAFDPFMDDIDDEAIFNLQEKTKLDFNQQNQQK